MRTIAAPSSADPGFRVARCYVCSNRINPTKPSLFGAMRSDEWPHRDWVFAHYECGETAGLRPVRLSSTEPIPATRESFEPPQYFDLGNGLAAFPARTLFMERYAPFFEGDSAFTLQRGIEEDEPRNGPPQYNFRVTCTDDDGTREIFTPFVTYDEALRALRNAEESNCGGKHDLQVKRVDVDA